MAGQDPKWNNQLPSVSSPSQHGQPIGQSGFPVQASIRYQNPGAVNNAYAGYHPQPGQLYRGKGPPSSNLQMNSIIQPAGPHIQHSINSGMSGSTLNHVLPSPGGSLFSPQPPIGHSNSDQNIPTGQIVNRTDLKENSSLVNGHNMPYQPGLPFTSNNAISSAPIVNGPPNGAGQPFPHGSRPVLAGQVSNTSVYSPPSLLQNQHGFRPQFSQNSSERPTMPTNIQPALPMGNLPNAAIRGPGPVTSSMMRPHLPYGPGSVTTPGSTSTIATSGVPLPNPPIIGQPLNPATMGYRPPGVPQVNTSFHGSERPSLELPVPFHGQAQYSSQVHQGPDQNTSGLVTPGSEPASQKSSRGPSPVPGQKFDALEGQFSSPTTPGTGTPHKGPQGPNFPPMPPQPGGGEGGGGLVHPQMIPPGGSGFPPQMNMGAGRPGGNLPQMQPPVSAVGVPGSMTGGIAGKRVYPTMPSYPQQPGVSEGYMPPPPPPQPGTIPGATGAANFSSGPGLHTYPPQPNIPPQLPPTSGVAVAPGHNNYMGNSVPNSSANNIVNSFSNMNIQPDSTRPINLLQEKTVIPAKGVETSLPNLPADYKKVNCQPEVFRCTLNSIPSSQSLLNKSRLPLGILIHPFKDLSQLPVIQSSVIVRCRSCRTYINPFVSFMDSRRWKCNLCYRVNELPEEFSYDPVSKTYGEPQRRPEIRSATIEFIAPSEYMLRPPQPAVYLYVLDVSFNAMETGYLELFCQTLLDEFDRIPGDSRAQIGFLTFDSSLHFYNLSEGLSQPQMMIVSDVEDVFLPVPEGLLANLNESKELVADLLNNLPTMFKGNMETGSALGPAIQAGYKLLSATGGRISVFQTQLPTVGPGSLKSREDTSERTGKKIQHLGPAIDFYKKLSLDCSALQIAVDTFILNSQYADVATIAGISKYSGGSFNYFPGLHSRSNPTECERFEGVLRRYFTRKIGFEAVMRIRCSRGLSIHTFHGNFFVRSTDLLSLPNVNPEAGFGMQMSIEDTIESNYVSFQAALLYTSSKGERRIRVHTLCIPVTNSITEIFTNADQIAICNLLAKMAVDKSLSQSMGDARDALVNSCVDMLSAYGNTLTSSQRMGQLPCPYSLRLMPLYVLALLKCAAFRVGIVTKLDDRVHALESCKSTPVSYFLQEVYPHLYPVHNLEDKDCLSKGDLMIPQPDLIQLSAGNLDRHGAYLMDLGSQMFLWLGAAISDKFCQDVLDMPTYQNIPDGLTELPELENGTSERLRLFIGYLNDQRPFTASFHIFREDSRFRVKFLQYLVEDRSESTFSYYEFLQHLQKEVK